MAAAKEAHLVEPKMKVGTMDLKMRNQCSAIVMLLITLLALALPSPQPTAAQDVDGTECLNIAYTPIQTNRLMKSGPAGWLIYDPLTGTLQPDKRIFQGNPVISSDGQFAVYFQPQLREPSPGNFVNSIVIRLVRQADKTVLVERDYGSSISEVFWSPDSRWLWFGGTIPKADTTLQTDANLIDVQTGAVIDLPERRVRAESISFPWSPDSKYLAMYNSISPGHIEQEKLSVWSVDTQTQTEVADHIYDIKFDPTSKYLAFIRFGPEMSLGIFSLLNGTVQTYPMSFRTEMKWSADGRYLVVGTQIIDPTSGIIADFNTVPEFDGQATVTYISPDGQFILLATWGSSATIVFNTLTRETSLLQNRIPLEFDHGLLWLRIDNGVVSMDVRTGDSWTPLFDNINDILPNDIVVPTPLDPSAVRGQIDATIISWAISSDERYVTALWREMTANNTAQWHLTWAMADDHFKQVRTIDLAEAHDLSSFPHLYGFAGEEGYFIVNQPQAELYDLRIVNLLSGEQSVPYTNLTRTLVLNTASAQDGSAAAFWWEDTSGNSGIDVYAVNGQRIDSLAAAAVAPYLVPWNTTGDVFRSPQGQTVVAWGFLNELPNSSSAIQVFDKAANSSQLLVFPFAKSLYWTTCQ